MGTKLDECGLHACLSAVLAALSLFAGAAVMASGQISNEDLLPQPNDNGNYQIGPGDVLDVIVSKNETLSRAGLRVSNVGTIQLPMLDYDIPAACLTERQLADAVKEQYKKYLVNPYVNVAVREFNSSPVAVIGAVNSPGRFQLKRQIRLVELLTFVNGPSANAGRTVEIIRDVSRLHCAEQKLVAPSDSGEGLLSVDLSDAFKKGDQSNPEILAGDIIRVSAADKLTAYIQGYVKSSMAIDLKDPVSLTQALAMAGGPAAGAQLEKVSIRRQMPGSLNRDEITVNLKEINQRKRDDLLIQANDIIEIPGPSGSKKLIQGIYRSIIPMVTRLPVTVIP
jgi:polysaccharide export outer membrane protein